MDDSDVRQWFAALNPGLELIYAAVVAVHFPFVCERPALML